MSWAWNGVGGPQVMTVIMVESRDGCKMDYRMTSFNFTTFFIAIVKWSQGWVSAKFFCKPEVRASTIHHSQHRPLQMAVSAGH